MLRQESGKGLGLVGWLGGMLSTDLASVWPPPTELLTLVSQKICVVVYPKGAEDLKMEDRNQDMEQQQPICQPPASKDKDAVGP